MQRIDSSFRSDLAKEVVDCDRAVIPVDMEKPGAMAVLERILGSSLSTCASPDPLITRFGHDVRLHGTWQLCRKQASGVILIKSNLAHQKAIAEHLQPQYTVGPREHKSQQTDVGMIEIRKIHMQR